MRLIDADELITAFPSGESVRTESVRATINHMPIIDIVCCVECRYKDMELCSMYKMRKAGVLYPYDFCSHGERMEE